MKFFSIALVFAALAPIAFAGTPKSTDPDADFDRLDGTGSSGKRVQVIEWENNLEIHVYPSGSLKGLALKLDDTNKDRPVMVIGYRFNNAPKQQLIRRAILGIPLHAGFKAFRDSSADDYDKIIISNQGLSDQVASFKLDPPPTQLYPDGHPALAKAAENKKEVRQPAARARASEESRDATPDSADAPDADAAANDSGTIRPFFMNRGER